MSDEREHETTERAVDRRRLLRRAGTVAAGVAGAGVVTAVAADPASAAEGDAVLQGRTNNVGSAATTSITNSSPTNPTLVLGNTSVAANGAFGPALQLTSSAAGAFLADTAPAGSLAADAEGVLWSAVQNGATAIPILVYTTATASFTVALGTPQRALDTRTATGRANLISPGSSIDGAGRIIGGRTVNLNLSGLVDVGLGVFANLTAVSPTGNGFITVFANGVSRPATSNLNFNGQTLSNFTISAIGGDPNSTTQHDVISIFCNVTTHVLFDVMAFIVQDASFIKEGLSAAASSPGLLSAQADRRQAGMARLRQRAAG